MTDLASKNGHISFNASTGEPLQTYWKKFASTKMFQGPALVVVHGGPTFGHNYLLCLRDLARRGAHSCVIFYDQIGCGNSSKVPERQNDSSFWNIELLRTELVNLVRHLDEIAPEAQSRYNLLGHSCGALLSCFLAANPPGNLQKLVLSNGMASLQLLHEAVEVQLKQYAPEIRKNIFEWEEFALGRRAECQVSQDDYMAALLMYRKDCVMRTDGPVPDELAESYKIVQSSRDSFRGFGGGDVQMIYSGSLENEDVTPVLPRIAVPTLVLNGEYDKASDICSAPLCKLILGAKRVVMSGTSHFPFHEDQAQYLSIINAFLES